MLFSLVSQLLIPDDVALERSSAFSRQMTTDAVHEPVLPIPTEQDLRQGLRNRQFHAYFQPKFELGNGAIYGFEVLARWHHPLLGTLAPPTFLGQLAAYGLVDELLSQQLHESAILLRHLDTQGYQCTISLNVLPEQLANRYWVARVRAVLQTYALRGQSLTFEVLETSHIDSLDDCLENCEQLRKLGCGLSMDDFGNGFSSLHRLCQLPFNEIKLDRAFVRALGVDPRGQAIIVSTLALGAALDVPVVIEGVETEEQRTALLALGCTLGQGYLCGRPMDRQTLLAWLCQRVLWS